jgi:branched-subunit amino acid ABC-type transport system permease component
MARRFKDIAAYCVLIAVLVVYPRGILREARQAV